jgi:hypothetical protein
LGVSKLRSRVFMCFIFLLIYYWCDTLQKYLFFRFLNVFMAGIL